MKRVETFSMALKIVSSLALTVFLLLAVFSYFLTDLAAAGINTTENLSSPGLIEYQLQVVEITERELQRFGLNKMMLDPDMIDITTFISRDNIIEIAANAGNLLFQLDAYQASLVTSQQVAPMLYTVLGESVSLKLAEEILEIDSRYQGGLLRLQQLIEIDLLPTKLAEDKSVMTDIRLNLGEASAVETRFRSVENQPQLIGFINWNRQSTPTQLLYRREVKAASTFLVFLQHRLLEINTIGSQTNMLAAAGLDNLLWPSIVPVIPLPGYLQIMLGPDINLLLLDQEQGAAFEIKTARRLDNIEIGLDGIIREELRLGFRALKNRKPDSEDIEIAVILSERLFIGDHFEISGAYYPVFFNLEERDFTAEHAYWLETALKFSPLSARFRYNSKIGCYALSAFLGVNLTDNMALIGGAQGNSGGVEKYTLGLRFEF